MGTRTLSNHGWTAPDFPVSDASEIENFHDELDRDVIIRGSEADRPAAGTTGRIYVANDTKKRFYDNGTSWDDITPSPSISHDGSEIMGSPSDLNFGTALAVTDDGDGTVTVGVDAVSEAELTFDPATQAELDAHAGNTSNPHSVTAAQVGAASASDLTSHENDTSNPHNVTAAQVGAEDEIFLAEGSGTNINGSSWNTMSWSSTVFNDTPFSFDGSNVTIQEDGAYEIHVDADFSSTGASRQNPNIGLQQNGNWIGVLGRSGYMRDSEGHNHSSVHAHAVISATSGDVIRARGAAEADTSGSISPDRAIFFIKKMNR